MKTKPLIEQHIHGCFGIDFNKASVNDMLHASQMLSKASVGGFFPTIVTDSIEKRVCSVLGNFLYLKNVAAIKSPFCVVGFTEFIFVFCNVLS